jgi:hypothetical protein
MATRKAPKQVDVLDELANGDPQRVMALMLWKNRLRNPDMYVQVTEADVRGFDDCVRYLKVEPQVKVYRPEGLAAQAAVPAQGNRRGVAAREASPPKPYVMIVLVDKKGDAIRPVENNEDDFDRAKDAAAVRKARQDAPGLAQRITHQARSGEYSLSDITDAANALLLLARAEE